MGIISYNANCLSQLNKRLTRTCYLHINHFPYPFERSVDSYRSCPFASCGVIPFHCSIRFARLHSSNFSSRKKC